MSYKEACIRRVTVKGSTGDSACVTPSTSAIAHNITQAAKASPSSVRWLRRAQLCTRPCSMQRDVAP